VQKLVILIYQCCWKKNTTTPLPVALGTLPYMGPELVDKWKNPNRKVDDLKMCDVYSFGILVFEVVSQTKPFEGLNVDNCFQRKVTEKEKPDVPSRFKESNPLVVLMKACWNDVPSSRIPFSKILDTDGLLFKLKKSITELSNYSEVLREKLEKKYKEGIEIEFTTFWEKMEGVFGKDNAAKSFSFFKILLNVTDQNHQKKVLKKDALRICDWLSGADSQWISEGFNNSFFYQHYVGEKNEKQIVNDQTLQVNMNNSSRCVLYWDPTYEAFCLSVGWYQKGKMNWEHHRLKTKTIVYVDLKKEVDKVLNMPRLKDLNTQWVPSLFIEIERYPDRHYRESGKTTSIYVN